MTRRQARFALIGMVAIGIGLFAGVVLTNVALMIGSGVTLSVYLSVLAILIDQDEKR